MSNSFIWPIDRILSDAIIPIQGGSGSIGNGGVLHIPQSSKIRVLPSDAFVSYPGHLLERSYSSTVVQLVYSTAPANWAVNYLV